MPTTSYDMTQPCAAPDPTLLSPEQDTGTAVTTSAGSCNGDPIDLTSALVGYATPISEIGTDDAGVCHVDEVGFSSAVEALFASTPCPYTPDPDAQHQVAIKGRLSEAFTDMSANLERLVYVQLRAVFVGRVPGGGTLNLHAARLDEGGNAVQTLLNENVANDGSLTRYERTLPGSGGFGTLTLAQRQAICRERLVQLQISTPDWGTYEVAFLGLRADWEQERPRVQPPQRIFPRDDGLIGPGARRTFPPPKSRQRSSRIQGGYL